MKDAGLLARLGRRRHLAAGPRDTGEVLVVLAANAEAPVHRVGSPSSSDTAAAR